VINLHPRVRMCCVTGRRNSIIGAIVSADVVAAFDQPDHAAAETEALRTEIIENCKKHLARHKIPAVIRFVPALGIGASGKLAR
jgi:acyl-coenzyme A synthetase/AMP-(fatty) acid ligase